MNVRFDIVLYKTRNNSRRGRKYMLACGYTTGGRKENIKILSVRVEVN